MKEAYVSFEAFRRLKAGGTEKNPDETRNLGSFSVGSYLYFGLLQILCLVQYD